MGELVDYEAKGIENGTTKGFFWGLRLVVENPFEFDDFDVFLELSVVDKGLLPFWYELSFKLL